MNLEKADRSTFEGFRIAGFSECLATFAATKSEVLHGLERWNQIDGAPRAEPVVPPQEYPPTPLGVEAPRCEGTKASEGYPPVAKSAEAVILGSGLAQTSLTHSSTGRARGLLRRRIKGSALNPSWRPVRFFTTPNDHLAWK
jgi:hypothetical protein